MLKLSIDKKELLALCFGFSVILFLYGGFVTKAHLSYAQDALDFAFWTENGYITKFNRHFLYNVLTFLFYQIWKILDIQGGALFASQIINSFFGAVGVILFYFLLKSITVEKKNICEIWIFTCFYAFSFAIWHFAGEANPQAFSNTLRILLLLLIISPNIKISYKRSILYGFLLGIILLTEILGVLVLPGILILFYFSCCSRRKQKVVIFISVATITYISLYYISCIYLLDMPIRKILSSLVLSPMPKDNLTISHLLIGFIYLNLAITFIEGVRTPSIGTTEILQIDNIITGTSLLVIIFIFCIMYLGSRLWNNIELKQRKIIIGCIVYFILPFGMQLIREPRALDNIYYVILPIWIIIYSIWITYIQCLDKKAVNIARLVLLTILALLVSNNFINGILQNSKLHAYEMYPLYQKLNNYIASDDIVILVSNSGNYEMYEIEYLLRNTGKLKRFPIILDGQKHRTFMIKDNERYELYRQYILKNNISKAYIVLMPQISLEVKGTIKKMLNKINQNLLSENTINSKKAIEVLNCLNVISNSYEVLDEKSGEYNIIEINLQY